MVERTWVHRTRSRSVTTLAIAAGLVFLSFGSPAALAQTFNSGSTGVDGTFNPTTSTTLTLPPDGVFNFTTINIPAGVTVTFARNTVNTPVTMLASGNITIAGTIDVSGSPGAVGSVGTNLAGDAGVGGAGGFDGGTGSNGLIGTTGGSGLGPGAGGGGTIAAFNPPTGVTGLGGGGAGFAGGGVPGNGGAGGPAYGTPTLLPIIGGSGGGGGGAPFGDTGSGGGGGSGGLLIASSGTITLSGSILALGGNGGNNLANVNGVGAGGGGSGGAIRLVATMITGSGGSINVSGGAGGQPQGSSVGQTRAGGGSSGRIRIEAFTNTATITFAQAPSIAQPGVLAPPGTPSLTITSVAGVSAPIAPTGSFSTPDITLPAGTANPMTIGLAASNIPLGATVTVTVTPLNGAASSAVSSGLAGTLAASTASASLTIPTNQPSVISASATFTLAALPGASPLYAEGETVELVRVSAILGGPSQLTYITTSGREVPATLRPVRDQEQNEPVTPLAPTGGEGPGEGAVGR